MDKRAFIKQVRNWDADAVAQTLVEQPELAQSIDRSGKTPLHHCAGINALEAGLVIANSIATARALVSAGADVNAIRIIIDDGEEFQASPLWYAVAWGKNAALARILLEQQAKPDNNAMKSAIWDQDELMSELLFSFGGKIDAVINHETPLLQTVRAGRLKLLNWLVKNGANINFQDRDGLTSLHHAVKGKHTQAQCEELLRLGANPHVMANDGTTAISLARSSGKKKLVALLKKSAEA